jgi:hypothetical protein
MIDPIKSLGIEKGRPFNPDATSRAALEAGARDAHDARALTARPYKEPLGDLPGSTSPGSTSFGD